MKEGRGGWSCCWEMEIVLGCSCCLDVDVVNTAFPYFVSVIN